MARVSEYGPLWEDKFNNLRNLYIGNTSSARIQAKAIAIGDANGGVRVANYLYFGNTSNKPVMTYCRSNLECHVCTCNGPHCTCDTVYVCCDCDCNNDCYDCGQCSCDDACGMDGNVYDCSHCSGDGGPGC